MITVIPQNLSAEVKLSYVTKRGFDYTVVTLYLDGEEYDTEMHMITRSTREFGWQFAYQDVMAILDHMLGSHKAYKYVTSIPSINTSIKERKEMTFSLYCESIIVDR